LSSRRSAIAFLGMFKLVVKVLYTKPEGYAIQSANDEFDHGINKNSSSEPLECEIKVSLQPLRINIDQVNVVQSVRCDRFFRVLQGHIGIHAAILH
jgi:hypothetical protein